MLCLRDRQLFARPRAGRPPVTCLHLGELAFARDALVRFVGALDPIFVLAIARKVLDHFINATWQKPTDCRVESYKLSDLEFVRAHIRVAELLRILMTHDGVRPVPRLAHKLAEMIFTTQRDSPVRVIPDKCGECATNSR